MKLGSRPAYPKVLLSVLRTAYVHIFRFLNRFFVDAPPICVCILRNMGVHVLPADFRTNTGKYGRVGRSVGRGGITARHKQCCTQCHCGAHLLFYILQQVGPPSEVHGVVLDSSPVLLQLRLLALLFFCLPILLLCLDSLFYCLLLCSTETESVAIS